MKPKSQIQMRMDLLEVGERLGWPRVGYGPGRRIRAGEATWTAFARTAPLSALAPALRNARTLADYYGADPELAPAPPMTATQKRVAALAKARAAKAAKRAVA